MSESNSHKTIKGMSSQTVVTILLGVVEIGSFSAMSRLLSQKDFGYFAAISAVMVIFSALSDAGIGSAIIQRKELNQKFLNNAFTLCLLFGFISCSILFACSNILANTIVDESMSMPLKIMSVTLITSSLSSAYLSTLLRKLKFFTIGMINLCALLTTSLIAICLAYYGCGYYAIIARTVLSSVFILILGAIISKTKFSLEWDKETIKSIWNFSGWLLFSSILRNLAQQIDRLFMSRLLSVDVLGAYNRPKDFIFQISGKVNGIFDSALFPVLSGVQDDYAKVRMAYKKALSYLNIFSVVLMMSFFFNAELLVRIFFGKEWLEIVSVFQILSCSLVFQIDARLADCFLRSLGWTKIQFYFRIFEVIAQIVGLVIGAQYGVKGVAISVVSVNFLCIWVKNYFITNNIGITLYDSIKTILSSWRIMYFVAPPMVILFFLLPHTFLYNCLNAFVYISLIIISFLFVPSIVGENYKNEIYKKVIFFLKSKYNKS